MTTACRLYFFAWLLCAFSSLESFLFPSPLCNFILCFLILRCHYSSITYKYFSVLCCLKPTWLPLWLAGIPIPVCIRFHWKEEQSQERWPASAFLALVDLHPTKYCNCTTLWTERGLWYKMVKSTGITAACWQLYSSVLDAKNSENAKRRCCG